MDLFPDEARYCEHTLDKMIQIFEARDDKTNEVQLVKLYRRILNGCNYNLFGKEYFENQKSFLNDLDEEQVDEITYQIEMYKYVRNLYGTYR